MSSPGGSPLSDPPVVHHSSIDRCELWRLRVPLRRPHVAAHGSVRDREVVLVALHGVDGEVGWGECEALPEPTYTSEWVAGAWALLSSIVVPRWLRGSPLSVEGHPMAGAALETAVADLALRRAGRSLADWLGATRPSVPTGAVVSTGGDIDDLLSAADLALGSGAEVLKVKVRPGHDTEVLAALRATWPDVALAADANGSYGGAGLDDLRALDRHGLRYLEQPLPADDLVGTARVAGALATPIALDESITGRAALETALALGACAVVNVKPARLGGVGAARDVLALAAGAHLDAFVGGMLELGVGRAAAVAVAALDGATLPTDLGPSARYVVDDVTDPVVVDEEGRVVVPAGPGIGVVPRPDRLAATAVDHLVVTA